MINKLQEIIEVIDRQNTGTPKELANKIGVSERMVYKYIDVIKNDFKAPVKYNRKMKTYYFSEKGKLNLNWQEKHKSEKVRDK